MVPEVKAKWLAALRSGEYTQAQERLKTYEGCFCCLGVLTDLYNKETGKGEWTPEDEGVVFSSGGDEEGTVLPDEVRIWAGLPICNPGVKVGDPDSPYNESLAELNDAGMVFGEIADKIEAQY
jgi:hypothetical protein